jgi:hypothetical protein
MLDPDTQYTVKSKFGGFKGSKTEPCRAVDAHSGGLEAQNGSLEGLL